MAFSLSASELIQALAAAAFGYAIGWAFFRALRVNAGWYLNSDQPLWRPLLLHGARFVAVTVALGGLTVLGWLPPLAALLGLTVARAAAVRRSPTAPIGEN